MLRLSSNITLTLRIAIPTMYIAFFGLFTLSLFIVDATTMPLATPFFRMIALTVYAFFVLLIYFTLMRLKRVEYQDDKLYVSNYLKNYRYDVSDIDSMKEYDLGICKLVRFRLKEKGSFGKQIYFIAKRSNLEVFRQNYLR